MIKEFLAITFLVATHALGAVDNKPEETRPPADLTAILKLLNSNPHLLDDVLEHIRHIKRQTTDPEESVILAPPGMFPSITVYSMSRRLSNCEKVCIGGTAMGILSFVALTVFFTLYFRTCPL